MKNLLSSILPKRTKTIKKTPSRINRGRSIMGIKCPMETKMAKIGRLRPGSISFLYNLWAF